MKTHLFFIFLFVQIQTLFAQNLTVSCKVIDSISSKPIIYANVGVKRLGIGTITNNEGTFVLSVNNYRKSDSLFISCIGYKNKKVSLQNCLQLNCIQLIPDTVTLNEVIIMPDSTLLTLLRKAYQKIPENYPRQSSRTKGLYREALKSEDSIYLYFLEAILDFYRNDYSKERKTAQIKIEKSRKRIFPGIDSINNVYFYGGPYAPINHDVIYQRRNLINPKYFYRYDYKLNTSVKFNDKVVYVIGFTRKDSIGIKGTLYIDKESLAYIGLDYIIPEKLHKNLKFNNYRDGDMKYSIRYTEFDKKFYLGYFFMCSEGYNTKTKKHINKILEYVTTSINIDSVKPIPLGEMLDYKDILSLKATDYDLSDWKDNAVIDDSQIKAQTLKLYYSESDARSYLTKKYSQNKKTSNTFLRIATKLSFDFGVSLINVKMQDGIYNLSYTKTPFLTFNRTLNVPENIFSIYMRYNYELTKKSFCHFSINESKVYSAYELGYSYKILFYPKHPYWTMNLGGLVSYSELLFNLGELSNNGTYIIEDKTFDSDKVSAFVGQRSYTFKPTIALSYKGIGLLGFFLQVSWNIDFHKQQIACFKETSGFFLTRKNQSLPLNNENVSLSCNNIAIKKIALETYPLQLQFGFKLEL